MLAQRKRLTTTAQQSTAAGKKEDNMTIKPMENVLHNSFSFLLTLLNQLCNLIRVFKQGIDDIDKDKSDEETKRILPISLPALKTSIIIFQFNVIETISNFLVDLTLKTNEELIEDAPKIKNSLTQTEIDFLNEQVSYLDYKNGSLTIQTRRNNVTILDKLSTVPVLLGKLYNIEFHLDKSGKRSNGWQKLTELKKIRDNIIHLKIDVSLLSDKPSNIKMDLDNIRPAFTVKNEALFSGCEAIRWYIQQFILLMGQIYIDDHKKSIKNLQNLDYLCWWMLYYLHTICGISKNTFNRNYPKNESWTLLK